MRLFLQNINNGVRGPFVMQYVARGHVPEPGSVAARKRSVQENQLRSSHARVKVAQSQVRFYNLLILI